MATSQEKIAELFTCGESRADFVKVLVLTSSTGGGHDLRANSIAAWAQQERDLGIEVEIYRPLENSGALNRFGVELYNTIQRTLPAAHHPYWSFLELAGMHRKASRIGGIKAFAEKLCDFRPDWVISVHAHLNHGYMDVARSVLGSCNVKVGTYCGELEGGYGFSRHWVNPNADLFIGASEQCCAAARKLGMPEDANMLGGFMLRPASYMPVGPEEKRIFKNEELNLNADTFTLLMATGAVGANNHMQLLKALDRAGLNLQVVALCGKSSELKRQIAHYRPKTPELKIVALPYVENMPLLLGSVDAVVARPGTGTTSESILAGCAIIPNALGLAMPQERITLKYLRHFKVDRVLHRPSYLPTIVSAWIENPRLLEDYRRCVLSARPPGTPRAILERIVGLTG